MKKSNDINNKFKKTWQNTDFTHTHTHIYIYIYIYIYAQGGAFFPIHTKINVTFTDSNFKPVLWILH